MGLCGTLSLVLLGTGNWEVRKRIMSIVRGMVGQAYDDVLSFLDIQYETDLFYIVMSGE